jgi:hypothetical protein
MRPTLPAILLGIALFGITGCQNGPENNSSSASGVSAIPWNKPASWEGAGALGGFMPQGGH